MDAQTLTVDQVFRALDDCIKANPTEGHEHRLHPDANAIGGLWAEMHMERRPSVDIARIKPKVLEALQRWVHA